MKVAKRKYPQMNDYKKWTPISDFLACGLVGVKIKTKLNLKNL